MTALTTTRNAAAISRWASGGGLNRKRGAAACWCLATLLFSVLLVPHARAEVGSSDPQSTGISVAPDHVGIDLLFGGADLSVRAEVPPGDAVGVRLTGPREQLRLQRKGRVWGVLWTGVEEVTIDDVPAVYLLAASAPLTDLARPEDLATHDLGYAALVADAGSNGDVFRELIKLKENQDLYAESVGDVLLTEGGANGAATLTASFRLPARVPPGTYTIELFGFQGREIRPLGSTTFQVEHTGLARALHQLALQHGLLYGCAAVIIAVIAGLLTGLVFGLRSGKKQTRVHRTGE